MAEHFMTAVVSCYNNAGVWLADIQCKITAVELT